MNSVIVYNNMKFFGVIKFNQYVLQKFSEYFLLSDCFLLIIYELYATARCGYI